MKTKNHSDDVVGLDSVYWLVYGVTSWKFEIFLCHEAVQLDANYFPFWYQLAHLDAECSNSVSHEVAWMNIQKKGNCFTTNVTEMKKVFIFSCTINFWNPKIFSYANGESRCK